MLDTLPNVKKKIECGVVNLDSDNGSGTHWVCYGIKTGVSWHFDSYRLPPPKEILKSLGNAGGDNITYSTFNIQQENVYICGHLCIYVLDEVMRRRIKFENTVLSLLQQQIWLTNLDQLVIVLILI